MLNNPCLVNTAYEPESSFTVPPRSTTLPVFFWYWSSSSEFLRWERSINDANWTFLPLFPCFFDHFFLVSDLRQLPCRYLLEFFQFLSLFLHCRLCIWNFLMLEASEWICAQDCNELKIHSFCSNVILMRFFVQLLLALVSCFRRHQQHKRILSCISQYCGGFLHCSLSVFSELPTFHERLSLWAWILRRLVQWRIFLSTLWHCRALVSRQPIFVLLLFRCIRHMLPTYLTTHCRVLRSFCFLVSPPPGPCISVKWPFVQ